MRHTAKSNININMSGCYTFVYLYSFALDKQFSVLKRLLSYYCPSVKMNQLKSSMKPVLACAFIIFSIILHFQKLE